MKNITLVMPAALQQPARNIYTTKDKKTLVAGTAIFIILFLNLFSPFGINNAEWDLLFMAIQSGYGLLAGGILYLFEFRIKKELRLLQVTSIPSWLMAVWYGGVTFAMAFSNYSYYSFLHLTTDQERYQFPAKSFSFFLWTTYLVAFIIGSGFVLYFRSQYRRKEIVHVKNVLVGAPSEGCLTFWSDNGKESFAVDMQHLLFMEKRDNYVVIYFIKGSAIEKHLLRTSLKELEEAIRFPLTRCHLSFVVNLEKVKHHTGNSKGLRLFMDGYEDPVPVSAKYYSKIIGELNRLSLSAPNPS